MIFYFIRYEQAADFSPFQHTSFIFLFYFTFFLFIFITFLWFFISLDMSKQLIFLLFNTAHFYFYCIFILCLWTYQIGIFPQKIWNFYVFKQTLHMVGRKLAVLSLNRVLISFSFLLHFFSISIILHKIRASSSFFSLVQLMYAV